MKKFSGKKIHVFGDHVIDFSVSRPNKGGHTHNHIYNVLYRSTFHHGPRSVGVMKPYYRRVLLTQIERFRYIVSKGELITKICLKETDEFKEAK